MNLILCADVLFLSTEAPYAHVQARAGDDDAAVDTKLYSHRWRRWAPPKPRNMDSNRASQEQSRDPEEAEGFPGLLSTEEADNSSQIEVGASSLTPAWGVAAPSVKVRRQASSSCNYMFFLHLV